MLCLDSVNAMKAYSHLLGCDKSFTFQSIKHTPLNFCCNYHELHIGLHVSLLCVKMKLCKSDTLQWKKKKKIHFQLIFSLQDDAKHRSYLALKESNALVKSNASIILEGANGKEQNTTESERRGNW